jgi:hypothetical protein
MLLALLLVWTAGTSAASSAPDEGADLTNLVKNPGFELLSENGAVPAFWSTGRMDAASIIKVDSKGYKGGRSLSMSGSGYLETIIKGIIPGRYYLLSFMVKRTGWRDGEYPTVSLFGKRLYLNDLFFWGGWRKASYLFRADREGETVLRIVTDRMSDRIIFDDLGLREFKIIPLEPEDGVEVPVKDLRFRWAMPEDDRVYSILIELSRSRDLTPVEKIVRYQSPRGWSLRLVNPLDAGRWFWRISVSHNRERLAASGIRSFMVVDTIHHGKKPSPLKRRGGGSRSRSGRVIEGFFPIGLYGAGIGAMDEIRDAGFNLVQSYNEAPAFIRRFVREANSHGLKALCTLRRPDRIKNLTEFIKDIGDIPALYGWYIEDEPEGRGVPPSYLWKVSRRIHSIDPDHPTALVNLRSWRVKDYEAAVDIVMVDPYPIPHMPVTWLSESIDEAREAVHDEKPVWAVIQAFNWADVGREFAGGRGRYPTFAEERCLAYLSIVHGARGVIFFSYGSSRRNDPELKNWRNVKRVVSELRSLYPLLLRKGLREGVAVEVMGSGGGEVDRVDRREKGVHYILKWLESDVEEPFRGFVLKKGLYLIAVNVVDEPLEVRFSGPVFRDGRVELLFEEEERGVNIRDGVLEDFFGPHDVKIYHIS